MSQVYGWKGEHRTSNMNPDNRCRGGLKKGTLVSPNCAAILCAVLAKCSGAFKKELSRRGFQGMLPALMEQVSLGIIGSGTVGGGVYQAIQRNGDLMASRLGVRLRVAKVAVRDLKKVRAVKVSPALLTTDWQSVVDDPAVNLVGEFMGGTTTARTVVLRAFKLGKSVVTANKALLSAHGEELLPPRCAKHRANLYYEASVATGIHRSSRCCARG